MSFVRAIRLLVGLALVAGGVSLAAPLVTRLVDAVVTDADGAGQQATVSAASPTGEAPHAEEAMRWPAAATASAGHAVPPMPVQAGTFGESPTREEPVTPERPMTREGMTRPTDVASATRAALPPWSAGLVSATPRLEPAYRSALQAPPPPLLDDVESAPRVRGRAVLTGMLPQPTRPTDVAPANEESRYRVRDGDDLTGIARRFYGHPHAAAAIWAANQDVIRDPAILPIGLELRLPPRWVVDAGGGSASEVAIEPRSTPETP